MRDYLLFIDVETSGLPKKWDKPYNVPGNWPSVVQVSWLVYTSNGKEVKQEDHFIKDKDILLSHTATKVHGITSSFLDDAGIKRKRTLSILNNDLKKYKPLVIGHFIQLDLHVLGADYYRSGVENRLAQFPTFCTMEASKHLVRNPTKKFLRLYELHQLLFKTSTVLHHNANEDARLTARCFFELLRRADIDAAKVSAEQKFVSEPKPANKKRGCMFMFSFLLILTIVILKLL